MDGYSRRGPSAPRDRRLNRCRLRRSRRSSDAWWRRSTTVQRSRRSSRRLIGSIERNRWLPSARYCGPRPFRRPVRVASDDALVIGAGAVGASAAYHLAEAGWSVRVVDAGGVAAGASGAAEGIVGSVAKRKAGPVTDIVRRSFAAFPTLSEALDHPIEFVRKPGLMVVHYSDDATLLQAFVKKRALERIAIEWLGKEASRAIEPALGEDIAGCVYTPEQGVVNPIQIAHAYLTEAKRKGATIVSGSCVTGFDQADGRITAVATSTGRYPVDVVI